MVIKFVLASLIFGCALSSAAGHIFAQPGDSGGRFPVYDRLWQQFDELKPSLAKPELSKEEIARLSSQLERMQALVDQLLSRQETATDRSEELIARMRALSGNLRLERANLIRRQPANIPTIKSEGNFGFATSSKTYAPGEDVEVIYLIAGRLAPTVWFGLLTASEPHRSIKYSAPIREFQPQTPSGGMRLDEDDMPDRNASIGSMIFRAPSKEGSYEIRLFDKESGAELDAVGFEVVSKTKAEFITELEQYRAEIEKERVAFARLWEYENIAATYTRIFRELGSKDPERYAKTWSQNGQWYYFVAGGKIYTVVFQDAIKALDASIRNLKAHGRPYTQADVEYAQGRMHEWRNRSYVLGIQMDAYAGIIGRRQKELVDLQTAGSPDEMRAEYGRRDKERAVKLKLIGEDINSDRKSPVFPRVIGAPQTNR